MTKSQEESIHDLATWAEFFLRPKFPWWKTGPTIPKVHIKSEVIGADLIDFDGGDIVPLAAEAWINERLTHRYIALGLDRITDNLIETDVRNLLLNLAKKNHLWPVQKICEYSDYSGRGPYHLYAWDKPVSSEPQPLENWGIMVGQPKLATVDLNEIVEEIQGAKPDLRRNRRRASSTSGNRKQ